MPRVTVGTAYGEIWDTKENGPAYIKCASDLTTTLKNLASPNAADTVDVAANERCLLTANAKTYGKVSSGTATVMIYPL
jgi:hypothetical protein